MRLTITSPENSTSQNPVSSAITRQSKDGVLNVVNILVGADYTIDQSGNITITSTGNITNDAITYSGSKINIAAESVDGTEVQKIGSFSSFMYFFPGLVIRGHSEVQDDNVGGGPVPVQVMQYKYEDLSTGDDIRVELAGGDGNANLTLKENVDGAVTTLATFQLPAGVKEIAWQLKFLDEGKTKFSYRLSTDSEFTRIFNGDISANLAECKVSAAIRLTQQVTKTVKSDYMFIIYPSMFLGYNVELVDRLTGELKVFDTKDSADEEDWERVRSRDFRFGGERVIENALIRLIFKDTTTPSIEVYGWNFLNLIPAWQKIGEIIPISSTEAISTIQQEVVITKLNPAQVKITARYGIVDFEIKMARGNPFITLLSNSTKFRIKTDKERVALSVGNTSTDIPDFNQANSDDVDRGNPANLSPPVNPFVFTNDNTATTGLDRINDNWYAWYNIEEDDTVGWLGTFFKPTGLTLQAIDDTTMDYLQWTFPKPGVVGIGVLPSRPTTIINGIPLPFHIGNNDEYVKYRANESIWSFSERQFIRRKR